MVRVYFNNRSTRDGLPWSVDYGAPNSEIQVRGIELEDISGEARFDPKEDRPNTPKAWIEFPEASLSIVRGIATIRGLA